MVADALVVRGIPVEHIMSVTKRDPHKLTSFAQVKGIQILYPGEPELNLDGGSTALEPRKKRAI